MLISRFILSLFSETKRHESRLFPACLVNSQIYHAYSLASGQRDLVRRLSRIEIHPFLCCSYIPTPHPSITMASTPTATHPRITNALSLQSNLSLYTVTALLILDSEGQRVFAKYYNPPHQAVPATGIPAELGVGAGGPGMGGLLGFKEQKAFEKSVFDKIRRGAGASLSLEL